MMPHQNDQDDMNMEYETTGVQVPTRPIQMRKNIHLESSRRDGTDPTNLGHHEEEPISRLQYSPPMKLIVVL